MALRRNREQSDTQYMLMKQRIISFDVGIKNMSYCLVECLEKRKMKILSMQTLSLKGKNIQDYTNSLISQLRKIELGYLDTVLIEQQLNRNTQMKVLSHVLQTYFICERNVSVEDVCFFNPKNKFEGGTLEYVLLVKDIKQSLNIHTHMSRTDIKKLSIGITTNLLRNDDPVWLEYIENNPKKDDLCDAYLQAYAYNFDKIDTSITIDDDIMEIDSDI
tara:strand:+ start:84 stop:737 length:654 start_codon:yes stop_codon:yes gene_type:complete